MYHVLQNVKVWLEATSLTCAILIYNSLTIKACICALIFNASIAAN